MLSAISLYYLFLSILLITVLVAVVSVGFVLGVNHLKRTNGDIIVPLGALVITMVLVWLAWIFLI